LIARAVAWSTNHRWLVIAAALIAASAGELARRAVSRDVLPELSDPQIGIVVEWMGHPADEVAEEVTHVLTQGLDGIAGSSAVRGLSMSSMAYLDVVFASGSSLEDGRQEIVKRIAQLRPKLPSNARVQVGPVASSTGWVFEYVLIDPTHGESPRTLRRFQEDILRPALASLPGVAEVSSVGGEVDQLLIDLRSEHLRARAIAFSDVLSSLKRALGASPAPSMSDLQALVIDNPSSLGDPPRLRDLAQVRISHEMPTGLADFGGGLPAVGGIVIARPDADLSLLLPTVKQALSLHRSQLGGGVKLLTAYDRSDLIGRIQKTLLRALGEEVAVVGLVILIFLLHVRSALLPIATLPVVLLLTFAGMWILSIPATIMSLSGIGIALGMAVDADVVALEACHRNLEMLEPGERGDERRARIIAAAGSLAPAILVSLLIAGLSFLPVLAFAGETGRLLRPLALTKTLVIAAAAVVTISLAPALRDGLLRGRMTPEFENPLTRALVRIYRPFVQFALRRPVVTLLVAALALISCVPIALRLGGEFLPRIDEGDLLFMPSTLAGAREDELAAQLSLQDRTLSESKGVASVFGKLGRADTATDPAPLSMAETTIRLRPKAEWPTVHRQRWYSSWAPALLRGALALLWPEETPVTVSELIERMDRAVRLPGWFSAWTAPARARMDMMATGMRTPIGIRIAAGDPNRIAALGSGLRTIALRVPGVRNAVFESSGDETWLEFAPDAKALAAHHVDRAVVEPVANLLLKGGQVGEIEKDGRRMRVRISQDSNLRGASDQLREITVRGSNAGFRQPVPLALLGRPRYVRRPAMVRSEGGELVSYVYIDVLEGTDLLGFVEAAKRELSKAVGTSEVKLGSEERIDWVGQYPLLIAGTQRLRWIVPVVAIWMFGLLYLLFRSLTESLIVLLSVPFALVGSLWTLYWLGYPLSAPVWVGLLSVAGLAMQTGVVMVVYVDEAFFRRVAEGRLNTREDIVAAHADGTVRRLRPKIMTITTMGAGLLPLLWAEGAGSEIMKRVAAPMVGGLVTSAFLTLEVLPVLYTIWRNRQLKRAQRHHLSIEAIAGSAPAWAHGGRR
jgi:Cu(I)/Ag(I) efflux system membrane protein CusA/SilA